MSYKCDALYDMARHALAVERTHGSTSRDKIDDERTWGSQNDEAEFFVNVSVTLKFRLS